MADDLINWIYAFGGILACAGFVWFEISERWRSKR